MSTSLPLPKSPTLETGGWLHLDVSLGCAGNMLVAALVDLGLPLGLIREGLTQVGLGALEPVCTRSHRGPLGGLHLSFLDPSGYPLEPTRRLPTVDQRASTVPRRRRARTPHRPQNATPDVPAVPVAMPVPRTMDDEDGTPACSPVAPAGAPSHQRPEGARRRRPPSWVESALDHQRVVARELLHWVRGSDLGPWPKAIADKTLRRMLEARAHIGGISLDDLALPGRFTLGLLCDVVAFAVLLEALSPAKVTASPIRLSTATSCLEGEEIPGPSPWVLQILSGVRVEDDDVAYETTTPTGASLLVSVTHHFGARGAFVPEQSGAGLGTRHVRGRSNLCRALYGRALGVGRHDGLLQSVRATLGEDADLGWLEIELARMGASGLRLIPQTGMQGQALREISFLLPEPQIEQAASCLYAHGAVSDIVMVAASRLKPEVRTVTVAVGRGKKEAMIRIEERLHEGRPVSAQPDPDDITQAARTLGQPAASLRGQALVAWQRATQVVLTPEVADDPTPEEGER